MSHTFENLKSRIKPKVKAVSAATKVPLIHTVRSKTDVDFLVKSIINGYLDGTDSISEGSTCAANKVLGIKSGALFFFAGRAFPEKNGHAYLMVAGCLPNADDTGERVDAKFDGFACPFDTGGLAGEKLLLKIPSKKPDLISEEEYKRYYECHRVIASAKDFREYFAVFLHEFFDKVSDYWTGLPASSIDGAKFDEDSSWRNWTFEVHTLKPLSFADVGKMVITPELSRKIENEIKTASTPMPMHQVRGIYEVSQTARRDADALALRLSV